MVTRWLRHHGNVFVSVIAEVGFSNINITSYIKEVFCRCEGVAKDRNTTDNLA